MHGRRSALLHLAHTKAYAARECSARSHSNSPFFQVVLLDDRVITGDFQCLDKQGNLILGNACEIIDHAHAPSSSSGACNGTSSSGGAGKAAAAAAVPGGSGRATPAPMEKTLGTVLVPKSQQKDVQLQVTLSEKAAMLELAGS